MGKINLLDENLMNLIAAGEVVERPSGVVKELVDNAIDANANIISIEIKNGGLDSIKISDNGIGMSFEDANLAFKRHATSKIKQVKDLWSIDSLGFRGEALPSISTVSKTTLITNDGNESTKVVIDNGELKTHEKTSANQGTIINVEKLFQKVPARFKYLKNPNYEFSLINDVVNKFALAYPNIAFTLAHNERTILKTAGKGNLQQVIMQVADRDIAKKCIPFDYEDDDFKITGYIVQPSITRANRYHMNLFVNGRMIKSIKLNKAIEKAYHEYIPSDRYPIVYLNLEMDPHLVDVNVHPSKWEVKFSKENSLLAALETGVYSHLQNYYRPTTTRSSVSDNNAINIEEETLKFDYTNFNKNNLLNDNEPSIISEKTNESLIEETITSNKKDEVEIDEVEIDNKENQESDQMFKEESVLEDVEIKERTGHELLENLQVIGQLHKAYILAQSPKGLIIIDQHAAQERYHFEQIKESIESGKVTKQHLLLPIDLKVHHYVIAKIDMITSLLDQLGFEIEAFGEDLLVVRSVPSWLTYLDEKGFILDLLELFKNDEDIVIGKLRHHAIATAACHGSIRFNRSLTIPEMKQVIEDLKKCKQPFSCPHGRPTLIEYDLKSLEKDFLRVK